MLRRTKLLTAVLSACAGVFLMLVLSGAANARIVQLPDGQVLSVLPMQGVRAPAGIRIPHLAGPGATGARKAAVAGCDTSTNSGLLTYGCGPVVHSSKPYLIFWDPGSSIPSGSESLLKRYLTDTSTSGTMAHDVFGVIRQYFDSSGYADQSQSFAASSQAFVDTQAYPTTGNCTPNTSGYSTCLTDSQVQAEISRLTAANGWPAGGTSANAPIYFVILPQSVDECFDSGSTTCADNYYCAYHNAFVNSGADALYAVVPLALLNAGKLCQYDVYSALQTPNGDPTDIAIGSFSHEYSETVTDPLGGTGWYDAFDNAEVGDLCAFYGSADPSVGTDPNAYSPVLGGDAGAGTLYDQVINGDHYYTQTEWSNGASDCRAQPDNATLRPAISAPSGARPGSSITLSPTGSVSAGGVSSTTWNFGDGTTSFASGPLAPVSHAYARAGRYTVTLSLVDDLGDVQQTTRQVSVGTPRITRMGIKTRGRSHHLLVSVNEGGKISVARRSATLSGAGTVALTLKLTPSQRKRLARHHPVKLHLTVVFSPRLGPIISVRRTFRL